MARKRPCRICRHWFDPHPRAGERQRTCSAPDCQRERHRRACATWRQQHPDYDREDRLRRRLQVPEKATPSAPLRGINWSAARDAVGLQVAVVIEETGQVLHNWARDTASAQVTDPKDFQPRVPP